MAAAQLMLPANRAFNSNGLAVPRAVAKLYTTGTLTPRAFYSDAALSVSLGTSITANGAGRFTPMPYGDDATAYRLRLEDADGAELDDIDPFYFGTTSLTVNSPAITPQDYGAVGDGIADDTAAIVAAIAASKAAATVGYGYATGGPPVYLPCGVYKITFTIEWDHSVRIFGDYGAGIGGGGSVIKPATAITCFRPLVGASGSAIEHLLFKGTVTDYTSAGEAEAHGVEMQQKVTVRDCMFLGMAGDGVHCGNGYNVNDAEISGCFFQQCRNGIYAEGADANALLIFNNHYFLQRRYGLWIKDTIGESLISDRDYSTNGVCTDQPTMCTSSSKWYYVLPGQEVGAKANAPSGTTANTAYWGYLSAATGASTDRPAWANTINFRSGGIMRLEGGSNYNHVKPCYLEPDQPPAVAQGQAVFDGWTTAKAFDGTPYGSQIYGNYAPVGFSVGSLPTGLLTGALVPRGYMSLVENVNEMWRYRDPTDTGGWYEIGDSKTADLKDGTDATIVRTVCGNVSSYSWNSGRAASPRGMIMFPKLTFGYGADARIVLTANIAPTSGDRGQGELIFNYAPTATAPSYWHCVSGHATNGGTWIANYLYARADPSTGIGYVTGAGGAVTQATSRTTAPPAINKVCGSITLVSAAGSASWQTFTVSNSTVAATDTVRVVQKSGTDKYMIHVTNVAASSFDVTFATTGGTTTEQPVFNFSVLKAVAA